MQYKVLFTLLFALLSGNALSDWKKINDLDYTWGPFKIYNISLFTETGEYQPNIRPLMLSLKYDKPVDGRDFAISIARSWARLDINLPEQNTVIDRLRKLLPDLKPGDTLNYIALADRGYFVVNDQVISEEFDKATNDAILAIWLDPKVELSHKLIAKKTAGTQNIHIAEYDPDDSDEINVVSPLTEEKPASSSKELSDGTATTTEAVDFEPESAKEKGQMQMHKQPVVGVPNKGIVETAQPKKADDSKANDAKTEEVKAESNQSDAVKEKVAAEKAEADKPAQEKETAPKSEEKAPEIDPQNPEIEIRPIEDPLPENIRAS